MNKFSTWGNAAWMSPYVITFFQVVKLVISKSKKAEHRISQISSMWALISGFTLVSRWWLHCFFSFSASKNISNFIKDNRRKCTHSWKKIKWKNWNPYCPYQGMLWLLHATFCWHGLDLLEAVGHSKSALILRFLFVFILGRVIQWLAFFNQDQSPSQHLSPVLNLTFTLHPVGVSFVNFASLFIIPPMSITSRKVRHILACFSQSGKNQGCCRCLNVASGRV